jgi:hypothetical protein
LTELKPFAVTILPTVEEIEMALTETAKSDSKTKRKKKAGKNVRGKKITKDNAFKLA